MSNTRARLKKIAKAEPRHCEQCTAEFKPNADGHTISVGEYHSTGLKWFCNDICSQNYFIEKGY